jgi:hypothetical protein
MKRMSVHYYIKNHHEPIVSEEVFEKAQTILRRRSNRRKGVEKGRREKYSRKYAFSSKLECAFCGSNLSRRNWHSGTDHEKVIWQCVTATKKGKKHCPTSKAIPEKLLEEAFVESYELLCDNNTDVLDEFVHRMESVLRSNDSKNRLVKVENEINLIEQKRDKLVDMHLDGIIDKTAYEKKYEELESNLSTLSNEREQLRQSTQEEINFEKRIVHFRKVLEQNKALTTFDRCVYESIVEKVIIGVIDGSGNVNPYKLTFVYKTGFINSVQSKMYKQMGNRRRENDTVNVPSYSVADTR